MIFVDVDVDLIGQFDCFLNFIVYWEDDVFSVCILMVNCSEFIMLFNGNVDKECYVDGIMYIDFLVSYNVLENLKIFIEGINLIDELIVVMVLFNVGGCVWNVM